MPRPRLTVETFQALSPHILDEAKKLKKELPERSVREILEILEGEKKMLREKCSEVR